MFGSFSYRQLLPFGILILALLAVSFLPFSVPYQISSRGVVMPAKQWILGRNQDGNLISTIKDNLTGTLSEYSVTEFQRGDVASFRVRDKWSSSKFISAGDTVGEISSNEEERALLYLKGQLKIQEAEMLFYTTGQKPEDVLEARNMLQLAKQELSTQQRLMRRTEEMFRDSLISYQAYDIALNELRVKEYNSKIAEARLASVMAGEKPEQALRVKAQTDALRLQMEQIEKRLASFRLVCPISGLVVRKKGVETPFDVLIEVADTSAYVVLFPVPYQELSFLNVGTPVELFAQDLPENVSGNVAHIDNSIQLIGGKQAVFVTAIFRGGDAVILPGRIVEINVVSTPVSLREYLYRVMFLLPMS